MKTVNEYGSEITGIVSESNKVKTLLRTLENDYVVLDTSNPSDEEKQKYSVGCGDVYVFMSLIADCVGRISDYIEPLMKEV